MGHKRNQLVEGSLSREELNIFHIVKYDKGLEDRQDATLDEKIYGLEHESGEIKCRNEEQWIEVVEDYIRNEVWIICNQCGLIGSNKTYEWNL